MINNSTVSGNTTSNNGGGISSYSYLAGYISVSNSIVNGNTATNDGGGVYSYADDGGSTIEVSSSIINGNTASEDGGGMFSFGNSSNSNILVSNSTISGNNAAVWGGGIFSFAGGNTSTVEVEHTTISGNNATGNGGGISCHGSWSYVDVNNSTFNGNVAANDGGGIFSSSPTNNSAVEVNFSTLVNNLATNGEGIYCASPSNTISALSSIFQNNNFNNNGSNSITSNGYNIFSDEPTGFDVINDQVNITDAELNLKPLGYYGGTSTKTMVPGVLSVAINTGDPLNSDNAQNGPINGVRDAGAAEACFTTSSFAISACADYTVPSGDETYTTSGIVMDTIQNVKGCDSIMTIDVTINPLPDNSITISQSNELQAVQTGATYQWIDCTDDSDINGATDQTFTPTVNAEYAVEVTLNGCTSTSNCEQTSLGIDDRNFADLRLYPNPTKGEFTVTTSENNVIVTVYNVVGKVILDNVLITNHQKTISLNGVESGVYFVKVSNASSSKTLKLIIE